MSAPSESAIEAAKRISQLWRAEAWETLTHELRHHLEWRARAPALEAFDRAVEQNFARQDGEPFDPLFYLDGEPAGEGAWRVEDDVFLDRLVAELPPTGAWTIALPMKIGKGSGGPLRLVGLVPR